MATDLGKAFVQIVPSAQGISGSITKVLNGESVSAGKSAGSNIAGNLIGTLKKLIPAAAIGKFIYDSINAGADLQQSFVGGLDTLYGDAADNMRDLAVQAASAGISANDYAEQAVSFGAALKQSFKGAENAEELAGQAANMAILDMADNSAKMGTDLASIQNAYQGFAKQNYTMLDNLKLGYGGTKSEMERLLKDAQKLSGVKYDINNLGDVYEAIHVIQKDLGIAGVAADEAKETFSGSFGAMKAAAQNLMGALSLGDEMDITPALQSLIESAGNFLFDNLVPMLGNILNGLPEVLSTVLQTALPAFSGKITELINNMIISIKANAPALVNGGVALLRNLVQGFAIGFPEMAKSGLDLLLELARGFAGGFPQMATEVSKLIGEMLKAVWDNRGQILEIGGNIIKGLVEGILNASSEVLKALLDVLKDAWGGVKSWLGIASPSKRFMYIGEMTGEGLAEGLFNSTGLIQNAMDDLLDPMSNPVVKPSLASGNVGLDSFVITFNIDNSGKDITDKDIERWGGKITDIVNNNLGRMVG